MGKITLRDYAQMVAGLAAFAIVFGFVEMGGLPMLWTLFVGE